ncbi:hypothetical protein HETIRDRAFT_477404 [Heterobasidion irregulare TC 32-1]|uniref:Endoplasmic reticulum transmembrane protein n=1 Tax=Heterobasidion irregulare (strain TC 32-1) TaxID=747525 RepID=W4K1X5_HETIT|nr:uncharacterized protein HETIRDRAFT_477404 [Heterobasidion irregulare TC 32-1]ETW79792.1 hypothetical protein HETIRDRAFT_477404 [Heterobasidion irregulare TC 32-1]
MTIYYSLTFILLAAEMVTFCVFVAPLPYQIRRRLFRFLSESPIVAKIAYALKISFIFITILFVDAVQRMFRVTAEVELAKAGGQGAQDVRTETNFAARKFYAQRNTYLTGFCLFLSLVLTRTFYILQELIHSQEEYAKLKKAVRLYISLPRTTLKKQASQQAAEYDRLAEQYNKETGKVSNKRVD